MSNDGGVATMHRMPPDLCQWNRKKRAGGVFSSAHVMCVSACVCACTCVLACVRVRVCVRELHVCLCVCM